MEKDVEVDEWEAKKKIKNIAIENRHEHLFFQCNDRIIVGVQCTPVQLVHTFRKNPMKKKTINKLILNMYVSMCVVRIVVVLVSISIFHQSVKCGRPKTEVSLYGLFA